PRARRSFLARRAVVGRTLTLCDLADRGMAPAAGPARALVDIEFLAEVAGRAVRTDEVAQRRAACADGEPEHRADRARETCRFRSRERPSAAPWTHACAEERLVRVDVSDSHDAPAVHQELLDRDALAARRAPEI